MRKAMDFILGLNSTLVRGCHVEKDCWAASLFGKKEYKLISN